MGCQIALNSAVYNYDVTLTDNNSDVVRQAKEWADDYLEGRISKGKMTEEQVAGIKARLHFITGLKEAVTDSDLDN